MRYLFCFLGAIIFTVSLAAQNRSISGRVIDQESGAPIEYASIVLYQQLDSVMLAGVVSDASGAFSLTAKTEMDLYCTIQFMGYRSVERPVSEAAEQDIGTIALVLNANLLSEVEVQARENTNVFTLDRQTFAAAQFRQAQGGNATDLLRNLPSVSVNALGEITVRGTTGFLLMINGRPVQSDPSVILSQLAAGSIDDIEIITAPSAKYDPDGKAGIINIKTRQGTPDGLFVTANAQWGLPSIEAYDNAESARRGNADLSVNLKKGKWDWSFGADYRRNDVSGRRVGYVNTYIDEILTEFPSYGERSFDRENHSGRIGLNYQVNERQQLGAAFYAGKRTQYRTADILYQNQQRTFLPTEQFRGPEYYWNRYQAADDIATEGRLVDRFTYFNENLRVRKGDFLIGALDYQWSWSNGSQLKVSGLYERTLLGGPTDNINLAAPGSNDTLQLQYNTNDNPLDGIRLQADFRKELEAMTWESGYQFRYLQHPGNFLYVDRDLDAQEWIVNPEFTNGIELRRGIHALYAQVSGEQGLWQYAFGLRLEYFNREVDIDQPQNTFTLEQVNPFPTANVQYDLGQGFAAKAAYSRRIQRTTTFKMTPFPEREHSETLEQGDAELRPEFVDLVELGLTKNWGDHQVSVTGYYRHTADVINRVNTIYNDTILNRIYTNAGEAQALGLEMSTTVYPVKNLQFYLGANVYNYQIEGQLFGDAINTSNTIYSINTNANWQISPTFSAQAAFNYLSRRVTAQGEDSRFYNPSLTLEKTFLNKKLTLSLQWLNMDLGWLEANEQRITTVRDDFFTTTNYIYEVDILTIGLRYQLNQVRKGKAIKSEFGEQEF